LQASTFFRTPSSPSHDLPPIRPNWLIVRLLWRIPKQEELHADHSDQEAVWQGTGASQGSLLQALNSLVMPDTGLPQGVAVISLLL
jgi:hypothetical protein